jgi:biopolymer transport protein ExbB
MMETYADFAQRLTGTLLALIIMSIIAMGVGLERLVSTLRHKRRLQQGRTSILQQLREGQHAAAKAMNQSIPPHPATPLFEMLLKPAGGLHWASEIRRAQGRVVRRAKKRLWILGSICSIAPFVGLLGTVIGVMEAFHAIGNQGAGGFAVVSSGISEALITTAAGIFVGVEAVVLFNYLQVCIAEYAAELRESVEEIGEYTAEAARALPSA